ncbi:MAG: methyltransferase domain-containing protein [Candidatus Gracilibacteria bacterium]|nr:methyltransferase domain-containing protein [Candidatus Gracilibacteria bacterium]
MENKMTGGLEDSRLTEIEQLLASQNPTELTEARKLTRMILDEDNDSLLLTFLKRQLLMSIIASSKRQGDPILQLQREFEIILWARNKAIESREDPEYAEMLMWLITAAGKEKQRKLLGRDSVFVEEKLDKATLTNNLLRLTQKIARNYDCYGNDFSATKFTRDIEINEIKNMLQSIDSRGVAIDLGCANGSMSRVLAEQGFEQVIGYDISPDMIQVATENKIHASENYKVHNLSLGIPEEDESIDCIIANFGSASEITDELLQEVNRILRKDGKAWLSFYNKDALAHKWWQPGQTSIEVVLNPIAHILEVPIIDNEKQTCEVYKIYAKPLSISEIEEQLQGTDLVLGEVSSFPLLCTMQPPVFFNESARVKQALEFDMSHGKVAPYNGYYLNIILQKK